MTEVCRQTYTHICIMGLQDQSSPCPLDQEQPYAVLEMHIRHAVLYQETTAQRLSTIQVQRGNFTAPMRNRTPGWYA